MVLNIQLIKYDLVRLTKTRGFLLALGIIVLSTLYLVPAPDARYCILKANDFVGAPNDLWIAITAAVSAVLIIATTTFFLLDGSYMHESSVPLFDLIRSTPISSKEFLLTRTATYFCLATTFLIVLIVAILIPQTDTIWTGQFNIVTFLTVLLYVSTPGLLFFSIVISLLEHFVAHRIWRILLYTLLINLLIIFSHRLLNPFLDFFGYFEIRNAVEQILIQKYKITPPITLNFGISPVDSIKKSFFMSSFRPSYYFWTKLSTLGILLVALIALARWRFEKFSLSCDIRSSEAGHIKLFRGAANLIVPFKQVPPTVSLRLAKTPAASFFRLFILEIKHIPLFLKWRSIFVILMTAIAASFLDTKLSLHYLPPVLFLFTLPLFTRYITYQDELRINSLITTTSVSYFSSLTIRFLVICFFIIIFMLPSLLRTPFSGIEFKLLVSILVFTFSSSMLSIVNMKVFGSTKLFEIIYILITLLTIYGKP